MNNLYERTIELKQQTHLVHFQIKRGDAKANRTFPTLRASEVKPRLDKEIVKYFKSNNIKYADWLAYNADGSEDFSALNYKMSITAEYDEYKTLSKNSPTSDDKEKEEDLSYLLFQNFDKEVDDEFILSLYKNTKINIKSIITKTIKFKFNNKDKEWGLLEFVEEFINYFLIVYSFGYRQLKCFGVYNTVSEMSDLDKIKVARTLFPDKKIIVYKSKQDLSNDEFYDVVKNFIVFVRECKKKSKFVSYFEYKKKIKERECLRMLFGLSNIYDENGKLLNERRFPSPLSFKKFGNYVLLVIDKNLVNEIPAKCVYKLSNNDNKFLKLDLRKTLKGASIKITDYTDKDIKNLFISKQLFSDKHEYEHLWYAYECVVCNAFDAVNKPNKDKNGNKNTNKKVSYDFERVM